MLQYDTRYRNLNNYNYFYTKIPNINIGIRTYNVSQMFQNFSA